MLFSRATGYAVRALAYLTAAGEGAHVPVNRIAEETDVPPPFLGKIVQKLVKAGILVTRKGPKGGVGLAKPAEQVDLFELVVAIEGESLWTNCVLGLNACVDEQPCPLHNDWVRIREEIRRMLQGKTLADIAARVREGSLRIRNLTEPASSNSQDELAREAPTERRKK